MRNTSRSVDDYMAATPKGTQPYLGAIGAAIGEVAPSAAESISYRMPYYSYKGRLVWFGFCKAHIVLCLRPPGDRGTHERALGIRKKSAVRLRLNRDVPAPLIKKLVMAQMKRSEAKEQHLL
jgi:uncharacterized protein YdhG (YjbR/CyaY superfamily)